MKGTMPSMEGHNAMKATMPSMEGHNVLKRFGLRWYMSTTTQYLKALNL